ncbi:MAG: 1,2-phenylacetyl-CoA epoxidase subunit PaaC [Pseudomonadota bacterium]
MDATVAEQEGSTELFTLLLRLADDHLIMGHRISEWCGHAPMLEEDLALPNIALDMIGQARALYTYAGEVEGKGRTEDDLAYFRVDREFMNCLLAERPNVDFGHTMLKIFYFAAFMELWWQRAENSTDATLAGIAGKAVKESAYHVRHSAEWLIRLGDGTDESARRMASAVAALHGYTPELFETDAVTDAMAGAGIAPDPTELLAPWSALVTQVFADAFLEVPETPFPRTGGRKGLHGEEMGLLLSEMQSLQRQMPGLTW